MKIYGVDIALSSIAVATRYSERVPEEFGSFILQVLELSFRSFVKVFGKIHNDRKNSNGDD
jgi:hypothetical protein